MISLPTQFTAEQARRLTGASSRQLRYWDQVGLVRPSVQSTEGRAGVMRIYSRDDLLRLRALVSLLEENITLQAIGMHGGFGDCRVRRCPGLWRCPGWQLLQAYKMCGDLENWKRESLLSLYGREPDPWRLTPAERHRYLSGHWIARGASA